MAEPSWERPPSSGFVRRQCNTVTGENSSIPQLNTAERKKSDGWHSAPCRGSRTSRSRHVHSRRAHGRRGPAAPPAPTRPVKRFRTAQKDHAGQPGCPWNSCLARASQLEKAKREYSTFKGVNSPAVYFFKKAFDFEQAARTCSGSGGGRKEEGEVQTPLKVSAQH